MGRKRKTLPKNFEELITAGDVTALKDVFTRCELDARGGHSKSTALSFYQVPDELVRWLVEKGADIHARNNYGETPLHNHARSWCGNPELLLNLGADLEAMNNRKETPLFAAAGSFHPKAVHILVTRGANINAKNIAGKTPLEKALSLCSNVNIVNMAEIAGILLAAGTAVTPEMKDSVKRIGTDFEFHREAFNEEYLQQTDEALLRLYELFDVTPIGKRMTHDGTSSITISTKGWQAQHGELWSLLVPSKGHAKTVQGEVIRITGKISCEILGNGGTNWDLQYRKMLNRLIDYFGLGTPLSSTLLQEAAALAKELHSGKGEDEPARLCELAVQWVLSNPHPIALEQPDYKR
ncbi:ankyrin repeat domain-containing protein [Paenibacillus sp. JX-17]|uniref:Ankyrin repeat domain-containing protein n=1 Tax=Paenibacillus lacisoli TaxID=3064525 RepID=A0ABT9CIB0_9BACL|nr:ankyrin repeat domain-containing protein [Paenibacillus sp. JX-17]MDO7907677.1 ankyrin repeat domain-containing protein [Paenibacillus sp. JX-17]